MGDSVSEVQAQLAGVGKLKVSEKRMGNRADGGQRSSADKERAVEIALEKFPEKNPEMVAAYVGCSPRYGSKIQSELSTSGKLNVPKTRMGKDGKMRATTYAPRQAKAAPVEEAPERPHIRSADELMAQQEAEREWTGRRSVIGTPPSGLPFNPTLRTA